MQPQTLTVRQLNRATLARQMLLERQKIPVVDAIEHLGGMQAQEPKPPFLGLWTRLEGFGPESLLRRLRDRQVVRATLMRATLHLMSARDYAAVRTSLQPMLEQGMSVLGARADGLELDRVLAAARRLLEEARDFSALRAALAELFPHVNERALGYAVRLHLPLVMVPTSDRWGFPRSADFALAERWLDDPLSDDESPRALATRYLAAFGPASAADFQAWSGLRGVKTVLDGMRDDLVTFRDERGRELLDLSDAPRPEPGVPAPPRLLPEFDSLVLAHADRTRIVADEHKGALVTKNLRVRATFLSNGFVRGTWTAERKRKIATIHLTPFEALPQGAVAELAAEGEALLRFAEPEATTFEVKIAEPAASAAVP